MNFVDNVAILAIENCLLRPLEHIFTGQTVVGMDEDQIREIATEPANIQKDRKGLNGELKKLLAGRQTLSAFSTDGSSLLAPPILGIKLLHNDLGEDKLTYIFNRTVSHWSQGSNQ